MGQCEGMSAAEPSAKSGKTNVGKFHSMPSGIIFKFVIAQKAAKICGLSVYGHKNKLLIRINDFQHVASFVALNVSVATLAAEGTVHCKNRN